MSILRHLDIEAACALDWDRGRLENAADLEDPTFIGDPHELAHDGLVSIVNYARQGGIDWLETAALDAIHRLREEMG